MLRRHLELAGEAQVPRRGAGRQRDHDRVHRHEGHVAEDGSPRRRPAAVAVLAVAAAEEAGQAGRVDEAGVDGIEGAPAEREGAHEAEDEPALPLRARGRRVVVGFSGVGHGCPKG